MSTLLASFVVIALAVTAMALGVLFGRAPIRGSCGGVAGNCAACSGNCPRRRDDHDDAATREKDAC